jgi:thiol-disulfide isomerase/thioredoxin
MMKASNGFGFVRNTLAGAAAMAALLAATPASGSLPSDPTLLLGLKGKSAAGLTFLPLDGAMQPLAQPGKPTVVIAFASWCVACIDEMPQTLADYAAYKDRVNFVGIDYTESAKTAREMVAKYRIPFPVEAFETAAPAASPAGSDPQQAHTFDLPASMTQKDIEQLKNQLPDDTYQKILAVFKARSTMSPSDFSAYETRMGIFFLDPKTMASEMAGSNKTMALPHAFVIDARGNVATIVEGYSPTVDRIALALIKLGLK